jgi:aspartate aminotransferase
MFAHRIQAVQASPTLRFTALARQLQSQGKTVYNLAAGEPDFDTPQPIKEAAIRAIREGFTKYTPTTGTADLKTAIVQYLTRQRHLTFRPEQVVVTCGAKQALYNVLQVLVQSGDEVLIPSPYWVSYPEMVRLAGAVPVEIRTQPEQGFHLTAEQVAQSCTPRTRCLILNSPSNPTGSVLDGRCLKELARVALERKLWIISDEIYCQLAYDREAPSIASVAPETAGQTVVIDGVSKAYAMTGWRIGFLAAPQEVSEAVGRLQDHSTSHPASISQKAAVAAFGSDSKMLKEMAGEFAARRDLLVKSLQGTPRILWSEPEGAFYCFVDISATGLKSGPFAERLLQEAQVAVIPGEGFGWDSHVRLSFALGREGLTEGLERFKRFIGNL